MNHVWSFKYNLVPEEVEWWSLKDSGYRELYNFHRLGKVQRYSSPKIKAGLNSDRKNKRKYRDPLEMEGIVLVLTKRLEKKGLPRKLKKGTPENSTKIKFLLLGMLYKQTKVDIYIGLRKEV